MKPEDLEKLKAVGLQESIAIDLVKKAEWGSVFLMRNRRHAKVKATSEDGVKRTQETETKEKHDNIKRNRIFSFEEVDDALSTLHQSARLRNRTTEDVRKEISDYYINNFNSLDVSLPEASKLPKLQERKGKVEKEKVESAKKTENIIVRWARALFNRVVRIINYFRKNKDTENAAAEIVAQQTKDGRETSHPDLIVTQEKEDGMPLPASRPRNLVTRKIEVRSKNTKDGVFANYDYTAPTTPGSSSGGRKVAVSLAVPKAPQDKSQ